MLTAATGLLDSLICRAKAVVRSMTLRLENRRLDRLYGALPLRSVGAAMDNVAQATALSGIVRTHCATGEGILAAHGTAAMKLDSAEYAFSSMLEELRGVMVKAPTDWSPTSSRSQPQSVEPTSVTGVRAA